MNKHTIEDYNHHKNQEFEKIKGYIESDKCLGDNNDKQFFLDIAQRLFDYKFRVKYLPEELCLHLYDMVEKLNLIAGKKLSQDSLIRLVGYFETIRNSANQNNINIFEEDVITLSPDFLKYNSMNALAAFKDFTKQHASVFVEEKDIQDIEFLIIRYKFAKQKYMLLTHSVEWDFNLEAIKYRQAIEKIIDPHLALLKKIQQSREDEINLTIKQYQAMVDDFKYAGELLYLALDIMRGYLVVNEDEKTAGVFTRATPCEVQTALNKLIMHSGKLPGAEAENKNKWAAVIGLVGLLIIAASVFAFPPLIPATLTIGTFLLANVVMWTGSTLGASLAVGATLFGMYARNKSIAGAHDHFIAKAQGDNQHNNVADNFALLRMQRL